MSILRLKIRMGVVAILLCLCAAATVLAQNERIEKTELYAYEIEDFIKGKDIASKLITSSGVDYSESYKVGWDSLNEVFGLEGIGLGFMGDLLEVEAAGKIGDKCGDIGLGLAIIQLGIDIYSGNAGPGVMNFSKSAGFWSIGKFGWQTLKIASIGVQFIDYALNKFGSTAIAAKLEIWNSAFRNYYNNGPGKRSLKQWREIFSKANSQEDIESAIRSHLSKFWDLGHEGLTYATQKTAALGFGEKWLAEPLESEKKAIEDSYMAEILLPYLKPLFYTMAQEAKDAQIKAVQAAYREIVKVLNTTREVQVIALGAKNLVAGLPVNLAEGFMNGTTDANGKCSFKFTVYGLLKHGIKSPAKVTIKIKTEKGEEELSQTADIKKKISTVKFNVGGVADIVGTVTDSREKKPIEGVRVEISKEKKSATTNATGEYRIKDIPDGEYQVTGIKKGYEKKSVQVSVKTEGPSEGKNPEVRADIELVPAAPSVKILFPKNGQLVEDLRPTIKASVEAGAEGLDKSAISMKFDGQAVDFDYNPQSGIVTYTPDLKEDPGTKCRHTVELSAELPGQEKKKVIASCAFTAGIRPQITQLELNKKFFEEPDKEPLFTGQIYDEHSGPDPGTLLVLLDGSPVKAEYGVLSPQWLNIFYFLRGTGMRGGQHTITVSITDNAGIPSRPRTLTFDIPGPNIQLVRPIDAGRVISGEAFALPIRVRNVGNGPAVNLMGMLFCNDRQYATVKNATASFGNLDPAQEATGAPLFNIQTAQNLGNPENGEPVIANFTLRLYQASFPNQFWQEQFSIPIYPGEMLGGTVYVKLIHGTYMKGEWPIHIAFQTVCLTGTGGNFTAISDANGNAVFRNIPPGDYTTYVPAWYTYGVKLGEYIKTVTVVAGQEARATLKGSCPYLYAWDGKEFVKENDIYSTARILARGHNPVVYTPSREEIKDVEYTDYLFLQKKVVPKDNHYVFRLEEIRNEISWTDFVRLMVVDHPKGTKICGDGKGGIYAYGKPVSPVSAFDDKGNNVVDLVKSCDSEGFKAFHESSLTLKFNTGEKIENARLLIRMKGWERVDRAYKPIPAVPPDVQIQTKDENGRWITRRSIFPRNEWDLTIVDMSPFLKGKKEAEVRLYITQCRTDKYHLIDFVGLDTSSLQKMKVTTLELKKAVHSFLGEVTENLSKEDRIYVQTYPQEWMDIYFDKIEEPAEERDFVFVSRGHYLYFDQGSALRLKR